VLARGSRVLSEHLDTIGVNASDLCLVADDGVSLYVEILFNAQCDVHDANIGLESVGKKSDNGDGWNKIDEPDASISEATVCYHHTMEQVPFIPVDVIPLGDVPILVLRCEPDRLRPAHASNRVALFLEDVLRFAVGSEDGLGVLVLLAMGGNVRLGVDRTSEKLLGVLGDCFHGTNIGLVPGGFTMLGLPCVGLLVAVHDRTGVLPDLLHRDLDGAEGGLLFHAANITPPSADILTRWEDFLE